MFKEEVYELNDILKKAQDLFISDRDNFLLKREYKKIREELIYVALFLKGQNKYYNKFYKIKGSENPDCIVFNEMDQKDSVGFEVMVLNEYGLKGKNIDAGVADFIFSKKGLNNYGDNCYLLIPIIKQGVIDIDLIVLKNKIMEYKSSGYFKYKDIFIIFWECAGVLRVVSLFKSFDNKRYSI